MPPKVVSVLFETIGAGKAAAETVALGGALKGFGSTALTTGSTTQAASGLINRALGSIRGSAASTAASAQVSGRAVQQSFAGMGSEATSAGAAAASARGPLLAMGAAVAGAGLFAFKSVDQFAASTAEVRKYARTSGESAEESSKLRFAMNRVGIDADTGAVAIGRFATRLGQGKIDLEQYGIETVRTSKGNIDIAATLTNVSDWFAKTSDQTAKSRVGMELFGRSWMNLLPFLSQGRTELEKFYKLAEKQGLIFSDEDLEAGKQYSRAMQDLRTAFEGLQIQVGRIAIPIFTQFTNALATGVEGVTEYEVGANALGFALKGGALPGIGSVTGALRAGSAVISGDWNNAWKGAVQAVPGVGNALSAFTGLLDDNTESTKSWAQRLEDAHEKVLSATPGSREYKEALKEVDEASKHVAKAQSDQASATESAKREMALAKITADPLTATLRDLAGATSGATSEAFKEGTVLGQRAEAAVKAQGAQRQFMQAVAEGNREQATSAAHSAAAARQQEIFSSAIAAGVHPVQAQKQAVFAYVGELRRMAEAIPVESPLRARLEQDIAVMAQHKGKLTAEERDLQAQIAAIKATGGQNQHNIMATQLSFQSFLRANHKNITTQEEQALQNTLGQIIATGGQNQGLIETFALQQREFRKKGSDDKISQSEMDLGNRLLVIVASNGNAMQLVEAAINNARELLGADGGNRYAGALHQKLRDGILPAEAILQTYNEVIGRKGGELIMAFGGRAPDIERHVGRGGVNPYAQARGGIVGDPSQGQIVDRPTIFGEHRTRGELFLPKEGIPESRGLSLLATGASWYGMDLHPQHMYRGGLYGLPEPQTPEEIGGWMRGPTISQSEKAVYMHAVAAVQRAEAAAALRALASGGGAVVADPSGLRLQELFWDPAGGRYRIGGHMDHVHAGTVAGQRWEMVQAYLQRGGIPARPTSTVRPGAITASGKTSLHALGRAVDYGDSANDPWRIFHALQPLADTGAWLPPGGVAVNATQFPERVLSPSETRRRERSFTINAPLTVEGNIYGDVDFERKVRDVHEGVVRETTLDLERAVAG